MAHIICPSVELEKFKARQYFMTDVEACEYFGMKLVKVHGKGNSEVCLEVEGGDPGCEEKMAAILKGRTEYGT